MIQPINYIKGSLTLVLLHAEGKIFYHILGMYVFGELAGFFFFMMCERNEGCFIIQEFVPISACLPGNSPVILPDFLLCFRDCDKYEFFMDELILSSYCK